MSKFATAGESSSSPSSSAASCRHLVLIAIQTREASEDWTLLQGRSNPWVQIVSLCWASSAWCLVNVERCMQIHPHLWRGSQRIGQVQSRFRGRSSFSTNGVIQSCVCLGDPLGKRSLGDACGFKKLLQQNLAWVKWMVGLSTHARSPLAMVDYFYVRGLSS